MERWELLLLIGLYVLVADIFYYELGKKGLLNKIRKSKLFKKRYDNFHSKLSKIIHKKTFVTILFAKISVGLALIAMVYFGTHLPRKKFYLNIILVNLLIMGFIAALVYIIGMNFPAVFDLIKTLQKEFLIVIIALVIFYSLEDIISKRLER